MRTGCSSALNSGVVFLSQITFIPKLKFQNVKVNERNAKQGFFELIDSTGTQFM